MDPNDELSWPCPSYVLCIKWALYNRQMNWLSSVKFGRVVLAAFVALEGVCIVRKENWQSSHETERS